MTRALSRTLFVAFTFFTSGVEAEVRIPASSADVALASGDINAALLYRRSACFRWRMSLLQDVPAQKFYLRLLTWPDCQSQAF